MGQSRVVEQGRRELFGGAHMQLEGGMQGVRRAALRQVVANGQSEGARQGGRASMAVRRMGCEKARRSSRESRIGVSNRIGAKGASEFGGECRVTNLLLLKCADVAYMQQSEGGSRRVCSTATMA